jgi:dipeptidyl aminopeptidase/acylaminoacyl peptidase
MPRAVYPWLLASAWLALLGGCGPASGDVSPNNQYRSPLARPRGWVIVIHGGGWQTEGKESVDATDYAAAFFDRHGWATYNIDYRPGGLSLPDAVSAYDWLRRLVGPRAEICAWGTSAGGNLALLLAARRPRLACVISEAGPTDLVRWPSQTAWAPPGVSPHTGPVYAYDHFILPTLRPANLWRFSPVYQARRIRARLLLGCSTWDYWCPPAQPREMKRARPRGTTVMFLAGAARTPPDNFTHANVTRAALRSWHRAELTLLANPAR